MLTYVGSSLTWAETALICVSKTIAERLRKFTILILHRNGSWVMLESV
jgi:hypothetical protein